MIAAHHPASIDTWPPLLVTTCQLTDHTGTPRSTTLALTMRTLPHTVSVDTHYSASESTTANDAHATSYSVRRHSRPLRHLQPTRAHRPTSANIRNITASNGHHFRSLPAPAHASRRNRNCSMPIAPDMCSCTTHSAPTCSSRTVREMARAISFVPHPTFLSRILSLRGSIYYSISFITYILFGLRGSVYFSLSRHNKYIIIIH